MAPCLKSLGTCLVNKVVIIKLRIWVKHRTYLFDKVGGTPSFQAPQDFALDKSLFKSDNEIGKKELKRLEVETCTKGSPEEDFRKDFKLETLSTEK